MEAFLMAKNSLSDRVFKKKKDHFSQKKSIILMEALLMSPTDHALQGGVLVLLEVTQDCGRMAGAH